MKCVGFITSFTETHKKEKKNPVHYSLFAKSLVMHFNYAKN